MKKLLIFVLALVIAISLTACGLTVSQVNSGETAPTNTPSATPSSTAGVTAAAPASSPGDNPGVPGGNPGSGQGPGGVPGGTSQPDSTPPAGTDTQQPNIPWEITVPEDGSDGNFKPKKEKVLEAQVILTIKVSGKASAHSPWIEIYNCALEFEATKTAVLGTETILGTYTGFGTFTETADEAAWLAAVNDMQGQVTAYKQEYSGPLTNVRFTLARAHPTWPGKDASESEKDYWASFLMEGKGTMHWDGQVTQSYYSWSDDSSSYSGPILIDGVRPLEPVAYDLDFNVRMFMPDVVHIWFTTPDLAEKIFFEGHIAQTLEWYDVS